MTNESEHDETIKALQAQLEAAKAKAKIEAMEAELAALKEKDASSAAQHAAEEARAADAAAAAAAAEQAARAQAEQEAAAAAAAEEAAQSAAAAGRAAELQAELDALRAKEAQVVAETTAAAASVTAVTPVPASVLPAPIAPAAPAPVAAAPAKAKAGGLVAALVVLILAFVATVGATFFAIRGDLRAPWAAPSAPPTDILLIGAGSLGPAPAKTDSPELITFDQLSQPATGAAPDAVSTFSVLEVAGSTPEIYGVSHAGCTTLDWSNADSAGAVAGVVAALNADETLGIDQALTAETYPGYFQHMIFGHLLADTRVTYNGYSSGASFPVQAVLQKGTLVAADRFGVPRLHCGSGVALTAPVAAGGETIFAGEAWGDLDLAEIVRITPASEAQSSFTVLPVGPANVQTAFAMSSRACSWPVAGCLAPSDLALAEAPEKATGAPAPTATECSNWAPGTTDADSVTTRVVNARTSPVQGFMVMSAADGCGSRHDFALGAGENRNMSGYWPGSLVLFTDGQSDSPVGDYVFGEKTLFVIQ